jgi:hypothetical protein
VLTIRQIIIDEDILGWGTANFDKLHENFERVLSVGDIPELPRGSPDSKIASYCLKNNYDLFTADAKSYKRFFEAGKNSVRITRYDSWEAGKKPVFLIQIDEH